MQTVLVSDTSSPLCSEVEQEGRTEVLSNMKAETDNLTKSSEENQLSCKTIAHNSHIK